MISKKNLDEYYQRYNRKKYMATDPVAFVHRYSRARDQEIVGFIASCLAYGRVAQIMKSVETVLARMEPGPFEFISQTSPDAFIKRLTGFSHRFCKAGDMANLMLALKTVLKEYNSLENVFAKGIRPDDETVLPGLDAFYQKLVAAGFEDGNHLVPAPWRKSACKRFNLYLRWMTRKDAVDPGGWGCVSPSQLIVPLDIHMHRICHALLFTQRKQANMKTALEITRAFRKIAPRDPTRYDFALTKASMLDKSFAVSIGI